MTVIFFLENHPDVAANMNIGISQRKTRNSLFDLRLIKSIGVNLLSFLTEKRYLSH